MAASTFLALLQPAQSYTELPLAALDPLLAPNHRRNQSVPSLFCFSSRRTRFRIMASFRQCLHARSHAMLLSWPYHVVLFRTVRSCNPAFPPSSWHLSFRSLREGSAGSAGQLGAAAGEPGHAPRYAPAALTAMAHAMVVAGCCAGQRPRSVRSLSHCGTASRDTNKRGGRV